MATNFSQQKGKRAERAAIQLLQPVVNKCYAKCGLTPPTLARNSMQSRFGGHDIVGLEWLALEIKHHEKQQLKVWWEQTKSQSIKHKQSLGKTYYGSIEPVLMYKANNVRWQVRLRGYLPAGKKRIKATVDISIETFLLWFEHRLDSELVETSQSN